MKLSDHLTAAADLARQRAAEALADGTPEDAERAERMAGHLERLAFNHRTAATYQGRPELDPEQREEGRS